MEFEVLIKPYFREQGNLKPFAETAVSGTNAETVQKRRGSEFPTFVQKRVEI